MPRVAVEFGVTSRCARFTIPAVSEMVATRRGTRAAAVARALRSVTESRARRGPGPARTVHALWTGVATGARGIYRALRALWLQVTCFFFAVFSVIGGFAAWREYHRYAARVVGPGRMLLGAAFSLLFGWFAVNSFWTAGKSMRRKS